MEALTPGEKIEAYQYCINKIITEYATTPHDINGSRYSAFSRSPYLCLLLKECLESWDFFIHLDSLDVFFPELFECRPLILDKEAVDCGGWWGFNDLGFIIRVMVCEWCIEQVKSQQ